MLSNIDLLVDKYPELGIVVRVNTTKSNSAEYIELHNLIGKRYKGKVSMSPGLVMNRTNDPSVTNLFDREDFSRFSLDLWQKHRIVSSWLMYQNSPHSECAIRNRNALSVDPEGNVYQCWENIGNKKRTIGRLDSEGNLTPTSTRQSLIVTSTVPTRLRRLSVLNVRTCLCVAVVVLYRGYKMNSKELKTIYVLHTKTT